MNRAWSRFSISCLYRLTHQILHAQPHYYQILCSSSNFSCITSLLSDPLCITSSLSNFSRITSPSSDSSCHLIIIRFFVYHLISSDSLCTTSYRQILHVLPHIIK